MCNERFWEKGNDNEKIVGGGSNTDLPIQTIWYPSHSISTSYGGVTKNKMNVSVGRKRSAKDNQGVLIASYNLGLDGIRVGSLDDNARFELIKRQVEDVQGLPRGYLDYVVEDHKTVDWIEKKDFMEHFATLCLSSKNFFLCDGKTRI